MFYEYVNNTKYTVYADGKWLSTMCLVFEAIRSLWNNWMLSVEPVNLRVSSEFSFTKFLLVDLK